MERLYAPVMNQALIYTSAVAALAVAHPDWKPEAWEAEAIVIAERWWTAAGHKTPPPASDAKVVISAARLLFKRLLEHEFDHDEYSPEIVQDIKSWVKLNPEPSR